jgi:hypothetical protein
LELTRTRLLARVSSVTRLHLGLVLTALPVALACFSDPVPTNTSGDGDGDATETGDGDGDPGDGDPGDGDGEPGDGDGEPGDGDGDGEPGDGDGDGDAVCGDGQTVVGELCLSEMPTQYPTMQSVQRLDVGKFNPERPGVVAVGIAPQASLLRGDGLGGLMNVELVPLLSPPRSVAAGDLDDDGDVDFVADGSTLTVLLNDGVGGWDSVEVMVGFSFANYRLLLGQVDGNAPLDLFYGDGYNTNWIPGEPFGGWSPGTPDSVQLTGGDSWLALTKFGFDGDDFPDLFVASQFEARISIARGTGNGSFEQIADADVCNPGACDIAELHATDVNGDDEPDIIASYESGFSVLLALGDGNFDTYQLNPSPGADHISSGDIDNDGDKDLVVASRFDGDLRLFLGDGTGTFGEPIVFDVPGNLTRTTAMTDLDGDGAMELLTAYDFNGGGWIGVFEANP